jgi:cell division transport system permease protein
MLGILAFILLSGEKLADQFKEKLEFTIIINDGIKEKDILALKDSLEKMPWVKSAEYVSKEEAAKIFSQDNGEDFKDLLDYNPLFASINLKLHSGYTSQDSINNIDKRLTSNKIVSEFYYEHKLVEVLNDNLRKIGWIIITISFLFIIIASTLIDSTIRLSMYANRFLIRSMQLVGATRSFITKPFISRSLLNGLIAAGIASILLLLLMNFAESQISELRALEDWPLYAAIFTAILLEGLIFSFISTYKAVRKYLKMKLDELY